MELIASCTENCECICSVFVQPESVLYYCRVIILILYSWKFRIIVSVAKACHFMLRCVDFSLSQQICKYFQLLCQYNCNYYHYYYTITIIIIDGEPEDPFCNIYPTGFDKFKITLQI